MPISVKYTIVSKNVSSLESKMNGKLKIFKFIFMIFQDVKLLIVPLKNYCEMQKKKKIFLFENLMEVSYFLRLSADQEYNIIVCT